MKALFLDRDGTLIIDKVYLADPAGVELIPGAGKALGQARSLGYRLFLFTNQSGIGRGYHTMDDTLRVNARMEELLDLSQPAFDAVCIAPEAPDQPSAYRKPSPRFILEQIAEHRLDPKKCWMVGDAAADIAAARAAGINAVLVRTGKIAPESLPEAAAHHIPIYASIVEFVSALT